MPNVPRLDAPDVYLPQQIAVENREIAYRINGMLSLGRGVHTERAGNLDAQYLRHTLPAFANTEFELWHGLGRVPVGYLLCETDGAVTIYSSRKGSWTDTVMYLMADNKGLSVLLMVW